MVNIGSTEYKRRYFDVGDIMDAAEGIGYTTNDNTWRYFVDGPKEGEVACLKPADIYFRTSVGYETPKDEE